MTAPSLNTAGVLAALAMMRPPTAYKALSHFVSKGRVLAHVAHYDPQEGLILLGRGVVHERTGLSETTARECLAELVDERVLERVGERAGSRAMAYRVNPEVRQWRVRWQVSIALVEDQVKFATGEFRAEEPDLSRGLKSARKRRFVARPIARATKSDPRAFVARPIARATKKTPLVDLPGLPARQMRAAQRSSNTSLSDSKISSSLGPEQSADYFRVSGALVRHVRAKWGTLQGAPAALLESLIRAGATAGELLPLVERIPPESHVSSGVAWLCQEWHAPAENPEPRGPSAEELVKRREKAVAMLRTWENAGDEELVSEARRNLAEIDDMLGGLDNASATGEDERSVEREG